MAIKEQMLEKKFAEVPFRASEDDIQNATSSFNGLLSLPLHLKHGGDYAIDGVKTGQFGYFRRHAGQDEGGRAKVFETKHEYHFGPNTRQAYESGEFGLPSEIREFCDHAETIYWMAIASLRDAFGRMYSEAPFGTRSGANLSNQFFDPLRLLNIHLRFVGYVRPSEDSETIANGHFDRSVFTLALAETEPGLEIGTLEDGSDLTPAEHKDGIAKFFAGRGWENMPADTRQLYPYISPAFHRVRNIGEYPVSASPIVRQAIVMFANTLDYETDVDPLLTHPRRARELALAAEM